MPEEVLKVLSIPRRQGAPMGARKRPPEQRQGSQRQALRGDPQAVALHHAAGPWPVSSLEMVRYGML